MAAGKRMGIIRKQYQCSQTRRANCITFGNSFGCIANRIQWVSYVADFFWQVCHFRNAARVIGNRTIRIQCHDNPRHRQHGGCSNSNTVQASKRVGTPDGKTHSQYRCCGGFHRNTQTSDDICAMTSGGGLGNVLHRAVFGCSVIFSNPHHCRCQHQANHRRTV